MERTKGEKDHPHSGDDHGERGGRGDIVHGQSEEDGHDARKDAEDARLDLEGKLEEYEEQDEEKEENPIDDSDHLGPPHGSGSSYVHRNSRRNDTLSSTCVETSEGDELGGKEFSCIRILFSELTKIGVAVDERGLEVGAADAREGRARREQDGPGHESVVRDII